MVTSVSVNVNHTLYHKSQITIVQVKENDSRLKLCFSLLKPEANQQTSQNHHHFPIDKMRTIKYQPYAGLKKLQ